MSDGEIAIMNALENSVIEALIRKLKRIIPLTEDDVEAIRGLSVSIKVLQAGEDIVRERDKPTHAAFILEGWAYAYKLIEQGKRQILQFFFPGDLPDVLNLRMKVSDFSLATLTQATIAFIPYRELDIVTLRHSTVMAALWELTLVDAGIFREWMTNLGSRPAHQRLAHLFCEFYVKQRALDMTDNECCACPLTQEMIGDALGITSVHVNRVLKDLRKDGLTFSGGRLSSSSWPRLMSYANFDPAYLRLETLEPL